MRRAAPGHRRAVVRLEQFPLTAPGSSGEKMTIAKPDHHLVDNVTDTRLLSFA